MKQIFFAMSAISLALFSYTMGRRHPIPVNPPNIRKCALLYQFEAKGHTYQYCLNPVDQKTGVAIPYTEEDTQRILCVQGGPQSGPICDKVMNRAPNADDVIGVDNLPTLAH